MIWKRHRKRFLEYCGNDALEEDFVVEEKGTIFSLKGFGEIIAPFTHARGRFVGYYARRRTQNGYQWYGSSGEWMNLRWDMKTPKLLLPGDSPEKLFWGDCNKVTLVAQWEDENHNRLQLGYRMFTNPLMAHAFGGMEKKTYHNTKKAFYHGVEKGYQYMEVDLSFTKDERLVLCHGWSPSNCKCIGLPYEESFADMTYERIMGMQVHGNPIMDAKEFYKLMKEHPSLCFEIDFHSFKGEAIQKRIHAMLEDFEHDEEVLDRLLIQAYSESMYEDMNAVHPFRYYQYIVGNKMDRLDDIITYALDHHICVLGLRANLAKPKLVQKIRNAGLYVMCYTVEKDVEIAQKLLDSGVNTLCTDFITDCMLRDNQKRMGHHPFFVYYNSNCPDARAVLSLPGENALVQTPSQAWEYKDPKRWENDGSRKLLPCMFHREGMLFLGWHLRTRIDGKQYWYCKDHMYHTKADWENDDRKAPYLFLDEMVLPIWTVKENMVFVMCAVWKKPGYETYPNR